MRKRTYEFDVGEGKLEEGDHYLEMSVNRRGVITVSVQESKRK